MERQGFTLIELIITLAVAVILVTLAGPAIGHLIRDQQITSTQHALLASLRHARFEAIRRRAPVIVCNGSPQEGCDSDNGWEQGWYTAAIPDGASGCRDKDQNGQCDSHAGEIVSEHEAIADSLSLDGNGILLTSRVRFQDDGFAQGYAGTFSICPGGDAELSGSGIVLNISGRMRNAEPSDLNC